MASAVLEEEVPCRDTDPLPSKDQDSNRDSPVAFTINFGLGDEDGELSKEKAKKLERFALRSSLRKPKSPRLPQSNSPSNNTSNNNNNMVKSGGLVREKSNLSFRGSYRAKSAVTTASSNNTTNSPTSYHNNSPATYTQQHQQHSVMSTPSSAKAAYRKDSSSNTTRHNETMSKLNQHSNSTLSSVPRDAQRDQNAALSRDRNEKSSSSARHHNSEQSADARRRLTTTLSPEEAKMISHFEKEIEAHSLEIVERSYEDDEFELESCPSETGTYTVGKDEEKKNQTAASEEKARYELENLVGENQTRNNYVQDWANRHAAHHNRHSPDTSGDARRNSPSSHGHRRNSPTHHARVSRGVSAPSLRPTLIPTPPLPGGDSGMCGDDGDLSPQPLGSGSGGTANSLSKSRRRLPPTPGGVSSTPVSGILSPESNPEFSPSTDSPSPTQESDEGENSYMKHTQHLVNVMEARINQVSGHTTSTSRAIKTSTIVKKKSTTTLPSNDGVSAKEAWERRKNYDPLIASGRKKEPVSGRKSSSSSIGRSPREDIKYEERGSAKSASSDSSGYFSRGEVGRHPSSLNRGDGGRFSMRGNPHKLKAISRPGVVSSKPANKPQSKLLATDKQNSRSSSCLTSKEAEFQAWKRRKNYDPLKSATASAAGIRNGSGNSTIRENGNSANCDRSIGNSSLIGSHRSSGGESDSGGGRFSGTNENNGGRFARSPRNAYAPSPTPHHQQTGSIQHKRIQEMSQSLIHGGAGSRGSHHVASTSDQPPPMQRSASFHYENVRMRGASNGNSGESDHHQLRMYSLQGTHPDDFAPRGGGMRGNTSEDESTEDYGSGCDSSNAEGVPRHYYLDEDELILPIYPSSSHRSIYNRSLSPKPSPSRSRSRLEALDNLVISTIYSVSSKLCNNTQSILKRAGLTFPPADEDQATTLETVLYLLEDVDLPCSPAKKTSRELSGTLRNLKKVEQALEVLHKLIESDQDD